MNLSFYMYSLQSKAIISLFFLLLSTEFTAQQNPQFSQYLQNPLVLNPAITGAEDFLDVTLGYRNQWTGFEGAPKTGTLSFHTPSALLFGKNRRSASESHSGLGVFIYSDDTGPINKSGYYLSYAYHLQASEEWFVSLGTFIGASQFSFNANDVELIENPNDILVQNTSNTNFDMSLGVYVYSKDLFVGLAANQIFDQEIPYDIDNGTLTTTGSLPRNYNVLVGSRIRVDRNWEVIPSGVLRTVENAPVQWDISVKTEYQNRLWGGLSYRNEESVYALVGFRVWDSFSVGYSYDYSISEFSNNQSGSHEIVMSYRIFGGNNKCGCAVNSL